MSGRGRGRGGRGYTPPTGGRQFLIKAAEESGLDSRNLRAVLNMSRPAFYPDIELHSSGNQKLLSVEKEKNGISEDTPTIIKSENGQSTVNPANNSLPKQFLSSGIQLTPQAIFLISKGREVHHRIQNSVFYVRATKDVPDVIRFSDSKRPPTYTDASAVLSHCLKGRKRTAMGVFIPEELVSGQRVVGSRSLNESGKVKVNLADLEVKERLRMRKGSVDEQSENGNQEFEFEVDGEEEDGEDYVMNYYESGDDESDGDGDGDKELTF